MNFRMSFLVFCFLPFFIPVPLAAQIAAQIAAQDAAPSAETDAGGDAGARIFPLIPLLETAVSGELRWRPDWPLNIPPDAFILKDDAAREASVSIVLSNGDAVITFTRDGEGRICEFPCFADGGAFQAGIEYGASGEIAGMKISAIAAPASAAGDNAAAESDAAADNEAAAGEDSAGADDAGDRRIEFLQGFLPSAGSPPALSRPARIFSGGAYYFVYFFAQGDFFSESWYSADGKFLAHYKALVFRSGDAWRTRSLQTWKDGNFIAADDFFDSGGNVSAVKSPAGNSSARYLGRQPRYWDCRLSGENAPAFRCALQWDEQGLLTGIRLEKPENPASGGADVTAAASPDPHIAEYRYDYDVNEAGNWTVRRDTAMENHAGLLIPVSGVEWKRKISFGE